MISITKGGGKPLIKKITLQVEFRNDKITFRKLSNPFSHNE